VRHLEAVEALADFANELSVLIELKEPRITAAREDEDGPFEFRATPIPSPK
jgi:hypothetical protein